MVWCAARFPRAPATPPAEKKVEYIYICTIHLLKDKRSPPKKKRSVGRGFLRGVCSGKGDTSLLSSLEKGAESKKVM
jgi:hypothetical protein